jgi:hypothetical protein
LLKHTLLNIEGSTVTALEDKTDDWRSMGVLKTFDQSEFIDAHSWEYSGLDKEGYVFYPNQCIEEGTSCKLHVHIHGCAAFVR